MEHEYGNHLTARYLAERLGISRSRFEHLFKAQTGESFRPTLRQLRLSKAQELLVKSSLSIKEIAGRVGFSGTPSFSRAFQRCYGQPPSRWRRRHAEVRDSTFG
jgi:transcriptional regulator GlxA family with amidase domain